MLGSPIARGVAPATRAAERLTWDLVSVDGRDRAWRREKFARLPDDFAIPVAKHYRHLWESASDVKAAHYLYELVEGLTKLEIDLRLTDDDLVAMAKRMADRCQRSLKASFSHSTIAQHLLRLCRRYGIRPPRGLDPTTRVQPNIAATLVQHSCVVPTLGRPASVAPTSDYRLPMGAIARLTDEMWWRRRLRRIHARLFETEAIRLHQVHRYAGRYVSDATFARCQQQRRRNERILASLSAVNEVGEEFTLDELMQRSLANPAIRRAELMVRIYGFDQLAKELGDDAQLLTVTCPSRMHAHLGHGGKSNPKYDPAWTPREAQRYLTKLWSRIRAKWQRNDIRPYGFRITEPHHDGTPHWHVLLFTKPAQSTAMVEIVREYAMADSPEEPGAVQHRFKVEKIDRTKGSATGYVAKYISKNIDGHGLTPSDGEPAPGTLAQRVTAWSSTWGIRQFQQIGGPPVSLWRELRRAPQIAANNGVLGQLADAANCGDWQRFVTLMGGPAVPRAELPISLAKRHDSRPGRYGEPIGLGIAGICHGNVVITTRLHTWTIKQKPQRQNCTCPGNDRPGQILHLPDATASIEGLPPWSSVNNCTEVGTGRTSSDT